jgi:capsular polysaccharide biosynthesis protein
MELRQLGAVLRRHLRLILLVTLATFAISSVLALRGPGSYTASMRLAISVVPDPRVGDFFKFDSYYAWLSSEYLADDLSEVIRSEAFAQDVSTVMGYELDAAGIANSTRVKKTHRLLDITVAAASPGQALQTAEAIEQVLNTRLPEYLAFLQVNNGYVKIINRPRVARTNSLPLAGAEILLRTLAGALAAIGLAFLLDYLDDKLRDRRQVESFLGMPVLAEIPTR